MSNVLGIHHITAICGEPQQNLDFYAGVLGLRFLKKTVNFDDPTTYHFYFGDETGRPGTALTFFSWPELPPGLTGAGQVTRIVFGVPVGGLEFWQARLQAEKIETKQEDSRQGSVLTFEDPDRLPLGLVEQAGMDAPNWHTDEIPPTAAIYGFAWAELGVSQREPTQLLLTHWLGWKEANNDKDNSEPLAEDETVWLQAAGDGPGKQLQLKTMTRPGRSGLGTVHHIAWRAKDDNAQLALAQKLAAEGIGVTPVQERFYFRSVYFREPGGNLFEIATDGPGFMIDENGEPLGETLHLPPWYEEKREIIQAQLTPVQVPLRTRKSDST